LFSEHNIRDAKASVTKREIHPLQRRAVRQPDIMAAGVRNGRAHGAVIDQRQPSICEQTPSCRLDVMDARRQACFRNEFAQEV
jgi:hypothetical protein